MLKMKMTFAAIAILSIMVLSKSTETMANSEEQRYSTGCRIITKDTSVVQKDANGRKCWGSVVISGCEGSCHSFSYPNWKFPYVISVHPVCIHGNKVPSLAILPDCEEGVISGTERYEYINAGSCNCSVCKSSETSCEGPERKRGKPSPPVDRKSFSLMDVLLRPDVPRQRKWPQFTPQILQPPVYP